MSLERPPKAKMLVVDDEPDNLDLLYRTFRRDFNVLRAESGIEALEILKQEGEVAVIISDQRMPEMKGTEFLSKTVPQFPNTMRIILTGFTDVEDLVEAINSGQVYKYITKPWDPSELKIVVQRAVETYDLLKQRSDELRRAQTQQHLLAMITKLAQEIDTPAAGLKTIADTFVEHLTADSCIFQLVEGDAVSDQYGIHSWNGMTDSWLANDPLTDAAIATKTPQTVSRVSQDGKLAELDPYKTLEIQTHVVVPVVYRGKLLGILSLQWKQPAAIQPHELELINLLAQQLVMIFVCANTAIP